MYKDYGPKGTGTGTEKEKRHAEGLRLTGYRSGGGGAGMRLVSSSAKPNKPSE
jgi:hypothetical protein